MAVDTATTIGGLDIAKPAATDLKSEGDDNFRHIKTVLKTAFANVTGAVTATHTELNYVDGVTSAIQTQLDAKAALASPTFTGTVVLPAATSIANVSATEITYLDGVTSAIQTQLDAKPSAASPTFTGVPAGPTAAAGTNTTQLATTAFVTTAVGGYAYGAVGTYGFFYSASGASAGDVAAGSNLLPAGVLSAPAVSSGGVAPSGSWIVMGRLASAGVTLFVRVS